MFSVARVVFLEWWKFLVPYGAVFGMFNQLANIQGTNEVTKTPTPLKKLCVAKPLVLCSSGNKSPTNLKGCMVILIEASMIHRIPTAMQSVAELAISNKVSEAAIVSSANKSLLLPHLTNHFLSEYNPIRVEQLAP